MSFFDEVEDDHPDQSKLKPFHIIKDKDDKSLLAWLIKTSESLQKQAEHRRPDRQSRRSLDPEAKKTATHQRIRPNRA